MIYMNCYCCYLVVDVSVDPAVVTRYISEHSVAVAAGAAGSGSMRDGSSKVPSSTRLADEWTTAISVATTDAASATVTSAHHVSGYMDSDGSQVGSVACVPVSDWHGSLLQDVVHVSRMSDLSPSSNVAVGSRWLSSW